MIVTASSSDPITETAPWILPRSDVYAHLSFAYSFPHASLHAEVKGGQWAEQLAAALPRLPYRLRTSDLSWKAGPDYDDMQSEYIRLFQVGGRSGPPCSLHAGYYTRDRASTLRELIRFYNYFGFRLTEGVMPDHISVQMEFMSRLASGEATDDDSALRAQRDFGRRHLAWIGQLLQRSERAKPTTFYRSLLALSARFVAADERFVRQASMGVL